MDPFRLSPSDFAFLWEQCKRCFWLKVLHGVRQPSMPMAGIFKVLETLQAGFYDGRRTEEVLPGLPPGVLRCGEMAVESEPVEGPGGSSWYVYGKTDSLIEFDDGTWGILDFKTTKISPAKAGTYSRQLNAYAYALGRPAAKPRILKGEAPARKVSRLGLLCFEPSELSQEAPGKQVYRGSAEWVEIPPDEAGLLASVGEMLGVLTGAPPGSGPECDWCSYAERMASGKFEKGPPPASGGQACPQCGAPMKQRTGKYGPFWGCTRYPDCRGTRQVPK